MGICFILFWFIWEWLLIYLILKIRFILLLKNKILSVWIQQSHVVTQKVLTGALEMVLYKDDKI